MMRKPLRNSQSRLISWEIQESTACEARLRHDLRSHLALGLHRHLPGRHRGDLGRYEKPPDVNQVINRYYLILLI